MMHLWNLFEVPAVEVGEVHAHRMRFGFEVPNEALGHLGIGGVANMSRSSLVDAQNEGDSGLYPAASSPAPLRRVSSSFAVSTDRLLAYEDNINVALPEKPVVGSPLRFPTSADTVNNSRTFAGNFPSIYESAAARAVRLNPEAHRSTASGHANLASAAPGSDSRAFNGNYPSIYESLAARTARLALAREEAAQSGRESPPVGPPASSSSASATRGVNMTRRRGANDDTAFTQPTMRRVRSNSEGSNIWRTDSEANYSTSGNERRELNALGYNRNSYNVFGNLEDE